MSIYLEYIKDLQDQEQHEIDQYVKLMTEYAEYAIKKIGNHAEFVAYAYLDGVKSAKELFEKCGLRAIHAYAIQDDYNDFVFEYDEKERNQPDYE